MFQGNLYLRWTDCTLVVSPFVDLIVNHAIFYLNLSYFIAVRSCGENLYTFGENGTFSFGF